MTRSRFVTGDEVFEADVVCIAGFDYIAQRETDISYRNQIFVALTRSRGFVQLSGVGDYPMFGEMRQVMAAGQQFSFTFTRHPRRDLGDGGVLAQKLEGQEPLRRTA